MLIKFKKDCEVRAIGKRGGYIKKLRANKEYKVDRTVHSADSIRVEFSDGIVIPRMARNIVIEVSS